jgi:hypothetical protein
MACSNALFYRLKSLYLCELIGYTNSTIIESGSLPTYIIIRK